MDDNIENIENLVIIAIIILLIVFIGSLLTLIIICYQRRNLLKNDFLRKHLLKKKNKLTSLSSSSDHHCFDDTYLIGKSNNGNEQIKKKQGGGFGSSNLELDDVRLHPNIDQILSDTQWVDDATGLIPHCLALLKGCHHLTERLVASIMSSMPRFTDEQQRLKLFEINRVANTISPRVDDVVEAMYPPLDPRLLESRCLSLLLSVSRFAIVITFTCSIRGQWIGDELKGLELQLKTLREVGQTLLLNGDENIGINNNPSKKEESINKSIPQELLKKNDEDQSSQEQSTTTITKSN